MIFLLPVIIVYIFGVALLGFRLSEAHHVSCVGGPLSLLAVSQGLGMYKDIISVSTLICVCCDLLCSNKL